MSNLTQKSKSSSKKNLLSLTNIRENFQALQRKPIQIILNPVTEVAVLVGFFLALITDQLGQGYLYVFSAVLVVVIIGIFKEAQKFIIYQKESIVLPIVINISNPSNSENALNTIFNIIDKEPNYSNHEDNLRKILGIEKQDLISIIQMIFLIMINSEVLNVEKSLIKSAIIDSIKS
jgi:hypothetical protein